MYIMKYRRTPHIRPRSTLGSQSWQATWQYLKRFLFLYYVTAWYLLFGACHGRWGWIVIAVDKTTALAIIIQHSQHVICRSAYYVAYYGRSWIAITADDTTMLHAISIHSFLGSYLIAMFVFIRAFFYKNGCCTIWKRFFSSILTDFLVFRPRPSPVRVKYAGFYYYSVNMFQCAFSLITLPHPFYSIAVISQ